MHKYVCDQNNDVKMHEMLLIKGRINISHCKPFRTLMVF